MPPFMAAFQRRRRHQVLAARPDRGWEDASEKVVAGQALVEQSTKFVIRMHRRRCTLSRRLESDQGNPVPQREISYLARNRISWNHRHMQ